MLLWFIGPTSPYIKLHHRAVTPPCIMLKLKRKTGGPERNHRRSQGRAMVPQISNFCSRLFNNFVAFTSSMQLLGL